MALALARDPERPAWLVLDAVFPTATGFRLARSVYSLALQQPYLHRLVRAKKHYVAYCPAPPKAPHRRGRPPRYGNKVRLQECFDHRHLFDTVHCHSYGQREAVQLLALPLLWKPLGDWLLFIFAITSRGPIVLMSSDLHLAPSTALELYGVRTRLALMFDALKNLLHAFWFRFWTHSLPRPPRRPRATRYLQAPAAAHLSTVAACWQAYETFVLCAAIAHGLLPLIALRFGSLVWQQHRLYLRTQSRALPSEKTGKQVLAPSMVQQFVHLPQNSILQKIPRGVDDDDDHDYEEDRWVAYSTAIINDFDTT